MKIVNWIAEGLRRDARRLRTRAIVALDDSRDYRRVGDMEMARAAQAVAREAISLSARKSRLARRLAA